MSSKHDFLWHINAISATLFYRHPPNSLLAQNKIYLLVKYNFNKWLK